MPSTRVISGIPADQAGKARAIRSRSMRDSPVKKSIW